MPIEHLDTFNEALAIIDHRSDVEIERRHPQIEAGAGWRLLAEDEPLHPGDGFQHPANPGIWIDYACRPDIFRGCGSEDSSYFVPKNDYAHTWPWRRRQETITQGAS